MIALTGPECGFVFATTGAGYTDLAVRAAKTLKAVCPDYPIDLFTDQKVDDPVFDQVIALDMVWHRPKIEALRRSRFRKTVCLDADMFVGPSKTNAARLSGRTRTNKIVVFEGEERHIGEVFDVEITRASPFTLYGTPAVLG